MQPEWAMAAAGFSPPFNIATSALIRQSSANLCGALLSVWGTRFSSSPPSPEWKKRQKNKEGNGTEVEAQKTEHSSPKEKRKKARYNFRGTRHSASANSYFLSVSVPLRTPSPNPCSPQRRNRLHAPKEAINLVGPSPPNKKATLGALSVSTHRVLTSLLTSPRSSLKDGDGIAATLPALIQQPEDFVAPVVAHRCMPQQELLVVAYEGFVFTARPLRSLCPFGGL